MPRLGLPRRPLPPVVNPGARGLLATRLGPALGLGLVLVCAACGIDPLVDTDLGEAPRCSEVDRWPAASTYAEDELLEAIDALRQSGAECDGEVLPGVSPLEPVPALQCAARLHGGDLIRHPELPVDHEGSDDSSTLGRANSAGYDGIARQELLAGDFAGADALMEAWQASPSHCRALLDADLDHVGVAQAQTRAGDRIVWVVVTGQERR